MQPEQVENELALRNKKRAAGFAPTARFCVLHLYQKSDRSAMIKLRPGAENPEAKYR